MTLLHFFFFIIFLIILYTTALQINGDDLLWAMSTLGFDKYIEPLRLYLAKYRDSVKAEKPDKPDKKLSGEKRKYNKGGSLDEDSQEKKPLSKYLQAKMARALASQQYNPPPPPPSQQQQHPHHSQLHHQQQVPLQMHYAAMSGGGGYGQLGQGALHVPPHYLTQQAPQYQMMMMPQQQQQSQSQSPQNLHQSHLSGGAP
jgi:hypothetical protein